MLIEFLIHFTMHGKNNMNFVEYSFKILRSVGSVGPENMIQ